MEIRGKTILVLGGAGLVGRAFCRKLLKLNPRKLVVGGLSEAEANEGISVLKPEAGNCELVPVWGNIFVRWDFKDLRRSPDPEQDQILNNPARRKQLLRDILDPLDAEILTENTFVRFLDEHKADAVIDCINTATGIAYQDLYSQSDRLRSEIEKIRNGASTDAAKLVDFTESLIGSQYIPQLVRHIQIMFEAMKPTKLSPETRRQHKVEAYIKCGTTGTGGMGLNIPYTHSEGKPSRVLLSKTSVAGAHSMLLMLMSITPDAPITKEFKPAAAIAWKDIRFDKIIRKGRPIPLVDVQPQYGEQLGETFCPEQANSAKPTGQDLRAVFIDTGENGVFSAGEFEAITSIGQMEFITPEEIADVMLNELIGGNTGKDVVSAIDAAVMGPTYRAGAIRDKALKRLAELEQSVGSDSVAFEILGPPRLSKLLFESYLMKRAFGTYESAFQATAEMRRHAAEELIRSDSDLRSQILTVGLPILLSDGKTVLRSDHVVIPPDPGKKKAFPVTAERVDQWCFDGWIDLRLKNWECWGERLKKMKEEAELDDGSEKSSRFHRGREFWWQGLPGGGEVPAPIRVGAVAGWLFTVEDEGERIKR
ncbi:MAG: short-chain dehydrogenase [bacterium]|nr:short-chain dehydrogenase [bacterium]